MGSINLALVMFYWWDFVVQLLARVFDLQWMSLF